MPQTSYDESEGLAFIESSHIQRNRSGPPPVLYEYRESLYVVRTVDADPNAFFNSWVHCRQMAFGIIPPSIGAPIGAPWFQRHRFESDSGNAGEAVGLTISGVPVPSDAVATGGALFDTVDTWRNWPGGFTIWNQSPLPDNPNSVWLQNASFFSASNQRAKMLYEPPDEDPREIMIYTSHKSRFKLVQARVGFTALATLRYGKIDTDGTPQALEYTIGIEPIILEFVGTYAPQVWHLIDQPAPFNSELVRFCVWGETPAEWSARTGIGIA